MSVISSLHNNDIIYQHFEDISSSSCTLRWRCGKLFVKTPEKLSQSYLYSVENEASLIKCLKHSPVSLVSIDPKLSNYLLKVWADACKQANKPIFLSIPAYRKLSKQRNQILVILQRIIDWVIALCLLIFMSPVVMGLLIIMQIYSPKLLFSYDWYIGENGQFFQAIKFGLNTKNEMTNFHSDLSKYFLDNFSHVLNVLRGKYCLINNRCLSLEDAVKLSFR